LKQGVSDPELGDVLVLIAGKRGALLHETKIGVELAKAGEHFEEHVQALALDAASHVQNEWPPL
jgi:hypothetical protein